MEQPFVKDLRDLAMVHVKPEVRTVLRGYADDIDGLIKAFVASGRNEDLVHLVGKWTRAKMFYNSLKVEPPTPPLAGAGTIEQERKAA